MSTFPVNHAAAVPSTFQYDPDDPSGTEVLRLSDTPTTARDSPAVRRARHHAESNLPAPRTQTTFQSASTPVAPQRQGVMSAAQFAADMIGKYDGGQHSCNDAADQQNTLVMLQTVKLSMTGLPPAEIAANLDGLQYAGALSQMSGEKREFFARRLNALRTAPDDRYADMRQSLQQGIQKEAGRLEADPVRRMHAVFNAPVGVAMLGDDGQKQMHALREQYARMIRPGATPQQREQAFAGAVQIKARMQDQILGKTQDVHAQQNKVWSESAARVAHMLDDAQKYSADSLRLPHNSDDPDWDATRRQAYAKTFPYQSVLEKLLSPDGYSQQERGSSTARTLPAEDRLRDLLTFQQGMSEPSSDISRRVAKLEQQAFPTLAQPGAELDAVSLPKSLNEVAANAPKHDQTYLQNLADGYENALKDLDLKTRTMLREHIPGLADKILYGIGRFVADLSPIPGMDWFATQMLDAQYPGHGGLSDQAVRNVDTAAMFFGLLLGGREPEAAEGKVKPLAGVAGEPHVNPPPSLPDKAVTDFERLFGQSGVAAGGAGNEHIAPVPATGSDTLPLAYATTPRGALTGDPKHPGIFNDAQGQRYIMNGQNTYAVRYDSDNATWRIYQPENATRPQYPVTQSADGTWRVHAEVGLKGGALSEGMKARVHLEVAAHPEDAIEQIANRLGISADDAVNSFDRGSGWNYRPEIALYAYRHPEMSTKEIARNCNVGETMVRNAKKEYQAGPIGRGSVSSVTDNAIIDTLRNRPDLSFDDIAQQYHVRPAHVALLDAVHHPRVVPPAQPAPSGTGSGQPSTSAANQSPPAASGGLSGAMKERLILQLAANPHETVAQAANTLGVSVQDAAVALGAPYRASRLPEIAIYAYRHPEKIDAQIASDIKAARSAVVSARAHYQIARSGLNSVSPAVDRAIVNTLRRRPDLCFDDIAQQHGVNPAHVALIDTIYHQSDPPPYNAALPGARAGTPPAPGATQPGSAAGDTLSDIEKETIRNDGHEGMNAFALSLLIGKPPALIADYMRTLEYLSQPGRSTSQTTGATSGTTGSDRRPTGIKRPIDDPGSGEPSSKVQLLTDAQMRYIDELKEAGLSRSDVARIVGKPEWVIDNYFRMHEAGDLPLRSDQQEAIDDLFLLGYDAHAISGETGIPEWQVEAYLRSSQLGKG